MPGQEKRRIFCTNLLIKKSNCDSFCAYCYLYKHSVHSTEKYWLEGDLQNRVSRILTYLRTHFQSPIIRILGGEIFLMQNIREFVDELLSNYPYVLIQTNARLIDSSLLEWIIQSKRILLQISLDGHTTEMNKLRGTNETLLKRILHTIAILKQNDVYVDIPIAMHKYNIQDFEKFINYCAEMPSGRCNSTQKITPMYLLDKDNQYTIDNSIYMKEIIEKYDMYKELLPPLPYLTNLLEKLNNGNLNEKCYDPKTCLTITDTGDVWNCSCSESGLHNLLTDPNSDPAMYGNSRMQRMMLRSKRHISICNDCFNFTSIVNLYFNETITLDELCENNYMYSLPEIKESLQLIKARL